MSINVYERPFLCEYGKTEACTLSRVGNATFQCKYIIIFTTVTKLGQQTNLTVFI